MEGLPNVLSNLMIAQGSSLSNRVDDANTTVIATSWEKKNVDQMHPLVDGSEV